jgi:uncharacterized membrane protein
MTPSAEHTLEATESLADDREGNPLLYRQAIAVLSLIAGLVALYLHLVKIGVFGFPACGRGNECVQAWFSSYGSFLGFDVALIGAVGYGLLTLVAVIGTLPKYENSRGITSVLLVLIVAAVLFTWRLKYGEWVMMKIFCVWCAESFVTIHACLVLAWLDRRRLAQLTAATPVTPRAG